MSTAVDGSVDGDPIVRLIGRYARSQGHLFALGVVASLLGRTVSLVPVFVLGVAIDAVFNDTIPYELPFLPAAWIPPTRLDQLWLSVGLIVASYALSVAFNWTQGVALSLFSNRIQHAIRTDTYAVMQRLDMAFFDDKQTGQVMSILNNDVRNLRSFLGSTVSGTIQLVATVVGIAAILFWLNAQLAFVTLIAVPLLGGFTLWFMRTVRPRYRELRSVIGELNTRLENNIGGIEVIKTSNTETYEDARIGEVSWAYYLRAWAVAKLEYLYQPTMELLAGVSFAATFALGGYWLVAGPPAFFSGDLFVGEFVTFLFMTQRFIDPLAGAGRLVNSYEDARASGERIFSLVDRPAAIAEAPNPVRLPAVEGRIEFDRVSFGYAPERRVLSDVSFAVEPGETLALVGPTGAGKTTVAKLLLRLYDVDEGVISIDGVDVRDVALDDLRRAIGYVSQDVFLFDGTVAENVRYGSFDASDEEVVAAAEAAEAHGFVENLPDGYDTRIGERGVKLSGGQRQRLSIARAMLQDPAILVLDEATSAVDTETELLIRRGLRRLTADRTTVLVAHRLSTVKDADTILVIDDGRVVERGAHDALIERHGLYATLWAVQAGEIDGLAAEFVRRATERADAGAEQSS